MQFLSIVLSLAAAASAIDVRFHGNNRCSGGVGWICTSLNPNVCCSLNLGTYPSIGFYGVPTNWFIETRGHTNGRCREIRTVNTLSGGTFQCLTQGGYSGAGYSFRSRKRAPAQQCTSTQKPDLLVLEDGQKYNLVDMEDSQIEELAAYAANATTAADIPEAFSQFANVE